MTVNIFKDTKYDFQIIDNTIENIFSGEWGEECIDKNGVSVIRTTNFTNDGIINFNNIIKRNVKEDKINNKILKENDIIIEKSGGGDNTPVGRVVFCDSKIEKERYICNNFTYVLRINNLINEPKYIFYYLFLMHKMGITEYFQNKTTGIRNLQLNDYLQISIPLPSLEEQERIVKIIESKLIAVDKAKKASDEQKILIEKLLSSVIQDIFYNKEGEKNSLGNICEFVYGDSLPKQNRVKGNIPVYGSNGQIDLHSKSLTEGKTIIVGRKGSIGEVHYSEIGCWVIDTAYYVKPLIEINIQYLYFLLKTLKLSKLNKASSIPGLNRDDVYKIDVNLPTIEEQERIVRIIETKLIAIKKTKNVVEELSSYINALPSSILRKAFNGEY